MTDLSIIIVTYNSGKFIEDCVTSVFKHTSGLSFDVVVVDNDSKDNTVEILHKLKKKYSKIKIIRSANKGFNHGNNLGMKNSDSKYIALLNPDTKLMNNAFKIIIDGMKANEKVGAAGACLYDEKGQLNQSSDFFPGLINLLLIAFKIKRNLYLADPRKKKMRVDMPIGACFVFQRDLIKQIGYMDEGYFLYFDETDYAFSMTKSGYKCYLFPEASIIHYQGMSTENLSEFSKRLYMESEIRFRKKHFGKLELKYSLKFYMLTLEIRRFLNHIYRKDAAVTKTLAADLSYYKKIYEQVV